MFGEDVPGSMEGAAGRVKAVPELEKALKKSSAPSIVGEGVGERSGGFAGLGEALRKISAASIVGEGAEKSRSPKLRVG